jgi:hypothetical protein
MYKGCTGMTALARTAYFTRGLCYALVYVAAVSFVWYYFDLSAIVSKPLAQLTLTDLACVFAIIPAFLFGGQLALICIFNPEIGEYWDTCAFAIWASVVIIITLHSFGVHFR